MRTFTAVTLDPEKPMLEGVIWNCGNVVLNNGMSFPSFKHLQDFLNTLPQRYMIEDVKETSNG